MNGMSAFLRLSGVTVDVRTPAEFAQGHIPGAFNLPLFTNEERAQIGTVYKQQGSRNAIELGIKIVGPQLGTFIDRAKEMIQNRRAKVLCWRGGMRSSSAAWLLQTAGFETAVLQGGYKAFRRWVLSSFDLPYRFIVLGGLTGSGKTAILHSLRDQGEQVLDLESLACHRGSAYGMHGLPPQPTTEQFENKIAMELSMFDSTRSIWIEDESRLIGRCHVPRPLFLQMRQSPLFLVERPYSERIAQLQSDYFNADLGLLVDATERISKKLGGSCTKDVIQSIRQGKLLDAIEKILRYYDATYSKGLKERQQPQWVLTASSFSSSDWATLLRQKYAEIHQPCAL